MSASLFLLHPLAHRMPLSPPKTRPNASDASDNEEQCLLLDEAQPIFSFNAGSDMHFEQSEARNRLEELRNGSDDPSVYDSAVRALEQLKEMSDMCSGFPYGQEIAMECCGRLRNALIAQVSVLRGKSGASRSQDPLPNSTPPTNHIPSQTPRYTGMDAFDSILAGRMLFELWGKWGLRIWLTREKDIWDQLQRLAREEISRDQWQAEVNSATALGPTHCDDADPLQGSELSRLTLPRLIDDAEKEKVANQCLHQMRELAYSFPFGQDIIISVLEGLKRNFLSDSQDRIVSPQAFENRVEKLLRRFRADLDNRDNVRHAWSQLSEMKTMVESDDFRLGKEPARWTCRRLEKGISSQENFEIYSPRTKSRNMRKDTFSNVAEGHKIFSDDLDSLGSEGLDKIKRKAAKSIHQLAINPLLTDDLRNQLRETAFLISDVAPAKMEAKKPPFESKSVVARITTAHTLFSRWIKWEDYEWAIEEYPVWSEIHRLASTSKNWKGKNWSEKWAREVLTLARNLPPDLSSDKKQRVAFSLRRLSQWAALPNTSTELISTALELGDSSHLTPELLINRQNLEESNFSTSIPGGSCKANVLVDATGNPRLADFGISRLIQEEVAEAETNERVPQRPALGESKYANDASLDPSIKHASLGGTLKIPGTPRWMAPESLKSHEPTKKRDMYAFAYLVLEIFNNENPYADLKNEDLQLISEAHLYTSILASRALESGDLQATDVKKCCLKSFLPDALWNIVIRCMRYEPQLRPDAVIVEKDMLALPASF
ncbi:hypothetical protein B0H19DRAFT_1259059 [Mycena capillaripes]|nr:hypothetical protein B0H19DRAFT_1259059 [Mycena capillaripes]